MSAPPAETHKTHPPIVIPQQQKVSQKQPGTDIQKLALRSRKTIAIAGEYWKIARQQGRDISKGQAILKRAKSEHKNTAYQLAIDLAKQSIEEFKSAKKTGASYTVRRGDCLWNIAKMKKHYGRGSMWVKIWRANEEKIPDFDLILPKQVLFIPAVKKGLTKETAGGKNGRQG